MSSFYHDRPDTNVGRPYTGEAYFVRIGSIQLFFSYNTLVGFSDGVSYMRRANIWGPTTSKHINYLGIKDFEEVEEDVLESYAFAALATQGTKSLFRLENYHG